jgi:hypothetical protein
VKCAAPKDRTFRGIGGQRCGADAVRQTQFGAFCQSCLEWKRDAFMESPFALMVERATGKPPTRNPFE